MKQDYGSMGVTKVLKVCQNPWMLQHHELVCFVYILISKKKKSTGKHVLITYTFKFITREGFQLFQMVT
jgi:hypothetical protein